MAVHTKKHLSKPAHRGRKIRIGIYAGTFDPVHAGHVAFALQAMEAAGLDEVIFMPERRPRARPGVEHFAHRVAMLKAALAPHTRLSVLETVERQFSVGRTLAGLTAAFPGVRLVFLMGSDTIMALPAWRYADRLIEQCEFVVGLRSAQQRSDVEKSVAAWNPYFTGVQLMDSYAPDISSSMIRQALRHNRHAKGLLASVRRYARHEWLYVSPAYHAT
jgi:nicotinate-nucleotide adenylyltransferase